MEENGKRTVFRVDRDGMQAAKRQVVREFPLRLTVNGRELPTLVASPHQLNFLVAGFLRLQGFIDSLDDILSLGICAEAGVAHVRLRGTLPERLRPILTSGCGTGVTFDLPDAEAGRGVPSTDGHFAPEDVRALMRRLAGRAEHYRSHGGIHSAAVGNGQDLLLYAEDLGRHNTLDRIAGEALFRGIDLTGRMLVATGRISTEMVGKAARLGIALVASRTSPTDLAVRLCEQAGITLIGYVRAESFEVYTHPERLQPSGEASRISRITGVILAGGESRRMGCDKSLLPVGGARFIDRIYRCMAALFDEVLLVTNSPDLYEGIPCRKVPDIHPTRSSLAGIHSGLLHARFERVFVVACDMPFLSQGVIREVCRHAGEGEVVIPCGNQGLEPLHAVYHKSCLPPLQEALDAGERRIVSFFPQVRVHEVPAEAFAAIDPQGISFRNINTPQEYFALRGAEFRDEAPVAAGTTVRDKRSKT